MNQEILLSVKDIKNGFLLTIVCSETDIIRKKQLMVYHLMFIEMRCWVLSAKAGAERQL